MDLSGHSALVALGLFTKTLKLAAHADGASVISCLLKEGSSPWKHEVELTFSWAPSGSLPDDLEMQIERRTTYRGRLQKRSLSEEDWKKLENCRPPTSPLRFVRVSQDQTPKLIRMYEKFELVRWQNQSLFKSLLHEICFSKNEKAEAARKIPSVQLGINPLYIEALKLFRRIPQLHFLMILGVEKLVLRNSIHLPLREASVFFFLQSPSYSWSDLFHFGETLQTLWLQASALGIAFQPYAGTLMAEFIKPNLRSPPLSQKQRDLLQAAVSEAQDFWRLDLYRFTMGFRLGYPSQDLKYSERREIDEFTTFVDKEK